MFVISRRKLYVFFTLIAVAVLSVAFEHNLQQRPQVQQVVALPVNSKVIVLDARTSVGEDGGAEAEDRDYRGRDKFEYYIKGAAIIRTSRKYSYFNKVR